jgi:putative flavoprotein involved in K+ transport
VSLRNRERVDTAVIGAGQAGLAVGYHLRRRRLPFVIVDQHERIGDAWRNRWDTLRLFTPGRYSGLPGMPFPGPASAYPTKDQAGDYLETYAREFELPVRTGVKVERLSGAGGRFEVFSGEEVISAANVVVATGAYQRPRVPSFAGEFDHDIVQLHSAGYRNPSQLQEGGVLVAGAGNSGAEIATELARHHQTWLSGPDTGQEPTSAGSVPDRILMPVMWLIATRLTVRATMGRKFRDHFLHPPRGIPLGRVRRKDIIAAGIKRVGRTIGVRDGYPLLEDGTVAEVSNVIWCTGYAPDFSWIDLLIGLPFLYSLSSALIGGVGRDAEYIVDHIASSGR